MYVIAWLIRDDRLLISIRNSFFSGSPFRQNSKVKRALIPGTDDSAPGDSTELKWEFDEDSGRYYVSFLDDQ